MRLTFSAITVMVTLFSLVSCATIPKEPIVLSLPVADDSKSVPAGFRVIGYLASDANLNLDTFDFHHLTQINWAFVLPQTHGRLGHVPNAARLTTLVEKAHAAGVKVIVSIGGWMDDSPKPKAFAAAGDDPTLLNSFVTATMDLVHQYNLDGIDIDWEFPDGGTRSSYENLILALAAHLHPEGKLLSTAVGDSNPSISDKALAALDFVNVMAYDSGWGPSSSSGYHSPREFAVGASEYWLKDRNLPPSKVNVGVPFYGRADANWSETKAYKDMVAADPAAAGSDDTAGFNYNGLATIQWKTRWAKAHAGGVMIWELSLDSTDGTSLLNAVFSTATETTAP